MGASLLGDRLAPKEEAMKPTWTLLPDLPDQPVNPRNLELEQEEYLQARLGAVLLAWLKDKEDERARA